MANFNQTPSGQANVDLALPSLAFVATSGNGTWNQPNYSWGGGNTVTLTLGSAPSITVPAGLLGSVVTVTSSTAPGIFSLNEQSASKRLGVWPSSPT